MAIEITVPRLGWTMEEGTFVGWLKNDGDPCAPANRSSRSKATKPSQEIEAIDSGILRIPPRCSHLAAPCALVNCLATWLQRSEPTALTKPSATAFTKDKCRAIRE